MTLSLVLGKQVMRMRRAYIYIYICARARACVCVCVCVCVCERVCALLVLTSGSQLI